MSFPKKRNKILSLVQQRNILKVTYPEFDEKIVQGRKLICSGNLRPTARSQIYSFKVSYRIGERPKIKIIEPILVKNSKGESIPHTYPGNQPCLYYKWDFDSSMAIAKTIVPWLVTWLYFYEDWHVTGNWNGKGKHHS